MACERTGGYVLLDDVGLDVGGGLAFTLSTWRRRARRWSEVAIRGEVWGAPRYLDELSEELQVRGFRQVPAGGAGRS